MSADERSAKLWDSLAPGYDDRRPDQGLTDPAIRSAWLALLRNHLPPAPSSVLDLGCGTGSLSVLLAEQGYVVTGMDFSPAMIATAEAKAARIGRIVTFVVADATAPALPAGSVDAIVSRQTLWALPDRRAALANWAALLRDGGTLLLVEGRFASGKGMSQAEIAEAWPDTVVGPEFADLSRDAALWGAPLTDQRLLAVGSRQPRSP